MLTRGGLEEFDGVAVGVFDLDLVAAGAGDEVVAEVDALVFEFGDAGGQNWTVDLVALGHYRFWKKGR